MSQLPIQYVLALKKFSPVAMILHSSHEAINRWHRVLGRIVYFLLFLHAAFYLNYFYQMGILSRRVVDLVPALGITALVGFILLDTTALSVVRTYSYRVFFITHLIVAFTLPPIIYFHHRTTLFYVAEGLGLFVIDLAVRKMGTFTADASIVPIHGSDLIKIVAPLAPQRVSRFREKPGTHVYLNIPPASRPSSGTFSPKSYIFECIFNPFTVASIADDPAALTLVARCRNGPMTQNLARLAHISTPGTRFPLSIEGPYGSAAHLPNLTGPDFDQVLLVAGGVGATFILPLYRSFLNDNPEARVHMVWAIRTASDATWPVTGTAENIFDDNRIQLFLTGDMFEGETDAGVSGTETNEIEMTQISRSQAKLSSGWNQRRPDLQKIVDDTFKRGVEERVAVVVCGPEAMASELRKHVGTWVRKGRRVFWHNESFAW